MFKMPPLPLVPAPVENDGNLFHCYLKPPKFYIKKKDLPKVKTDTIWKTSFKGLIQKYVSDNNYKGGKIFKSTKAFARWTKPDKGAYAKIKVEIITENQIKLLELPKFTVVQKKVKRKSLQNRKIASQRKRTLASLEQNGDVLFAAAIPSVSTRPPSKRLREKANDKASKKSYIDDLSDDEVVDDDDVTNFSIKGTETEKKALKNAASPSASLVTKFDASNKKGRWSKIQPIVKNNVSQETKAMHDHRYSNTRHLDVSGESSSLSKAPKSLSKKKSKLSSPSQVESVSYIDESNDFVVEKEELPETEEFSEEILDEMFSTTSLRGMLKKLLPSIGKERDSTRKYDPFVLLKQIPEVTLNKYIGIKSKTELPEDIKIEIQPFEEDIEFDASVSNSANTLHENIESIDITQCTVSTSHGVNFEEKITKFSNRLNELQLFFNKVEQLFISSNTTTSEYKNMFLQVENHLKTLQREDNFMKALCADISSGQSGPELFTSLLLKNEKDIKKQELKLNFLNEMLELSNNDAQSDEESYLLAESESIDPLSLPVDQNTTVTSLQSHSISTYAIDNSNSSLLPEYTLEKSADQNNLIVPDLPGLLVKSEQDEINQIIAKDEPIFDSSTEYFNAHAEVHQGSEDISMN